MRQSIVVGMGEKNTIMAKYAFLECARTLSATTVW